MTLSYPLLPGLTIFPLSSPSSCLTTDSTSAGTSSIIRRFVAKKIMGTTKEESYQFVFGWLARGWKSQQILEHMWYIIFLTLTDLEFHVLVLGTRALPCTTYVNSTLNTLGNNPIPFLPFPITSRHYSLPLCHYERFWHSLNHAPEPENRTKLPPLHSLGEDTMKIYNQLDISGCDG